MQKDRQVLINTSRGEIIEDGVLKIYLNNKTQTSWIRCIK